VGHYAASMDELVTAGLLHSVPSSMAYTVTYTVTSDADTGNSSVDVSSSYCAQGSSTGTPSGSPPASSSDAPPTTIVKGSDPGSKYCVELGTALGKYGTLDLAGFADQGLPAVRNSLGRLQTLSADDQLASSWKAVSDSYPLSTRSWSAPASSGATSGRSRAVRRPRASTRRRPTPPAPTSRCR
jgi:hypothetical protein